MGHNSRSRCFGVSVPPSGWFFPARRRVITNVLQRRGATERSHLGSGDTQTGLHRQAEVKCGDDLNFALFLCAIRLNYLQAACTGDVQPHSKLSAKGISQLLGAPRELQLLLQLGTRAGTPRGAWGREFSRLWELNWPPGAGSKCRVSSERWNSSFPVGPCPDVMRALTF